ncbi:hypothetical protein [Dyadobacter chenhuakuii]|uniref:Uncharacterized protein n=1 Tax=Dyadobacter chenhuakuii TaxID=2909339 RepID=A0A9X1TRI5_9BACT|nr:hypothetical protein [Dyadobacter chenhuakuii]MCF2496990.1 hypothetical protein [Dyadobacter chenhuakuii]
MAHRSHAGPHGWFVVGFAQSPFELVYDLALSFWLWDNFTVSDSDPSSLLTYDTFSVTAIRSSIQMTVTI